jgi:hypothetical protein
MQNIKGCLARKKYILCLNNANAWLGRRDSNPRMPGPKPGALPLGHAPLIEVILAYNDHPHNWISVCRGVLI